MAGGCNRASFCLIGKDRKGPASRVASCDNVIVHDILSEKDLHQLRQAFTFRNIITTIPVLVLLHVVLKAIYNLYLSPLASYPGPKLWAISRLPWNHANMKGRISWKIRELHDKYGPIVRIAPDELSYTTSGAWKKIYGQRNPEFSKALDGRGIAPASIGGQRSLMTEHQDRHLRLRKAIDPAFSQKALREQENYFQDHSNNLIQKLKQRCKDGPLDMTTWFNLVAFDIVSDLAFGESSGCVDNPSQPWIAAILARAKAIVWFQLAVQYGAMGLLNWLTPKYVTESRKKHIAMTEAKLKARIEAKNPGKDFMSYILENDEKLNHLELVMLSSNFIVAGSGTSAGGMSGLMYLLLRNPEKLSKLQQEIRSLFQDPADMTVQAVTSCKYLRACINEGMRLYPPTPGSLPRFVPGKGEMIEGRWVPGGFAVGVNQLSAGHSERNFRYAREFHPERWLDEPGSEFQNDDRSSVQPFSYGQRACLGRSMAYAEMSLTMAKLVRFFDWELHEPENDWWSKQGTFLVWEKLPLLVDLTPISENVH
ncbi:cytochrome P450 monooxygenase alt3 [Parastagonospora nodorum]|nr:cytochrome P450 monooxygenase alt3 [Parastagonospora nodorum]KAH4984346.1 cytochrome P450 monooxygenase alt3 [Parastagonospora nodorum]KAH5363170.1 cytochrome P450 monooxygenase alt3 [Parastagonospora nodorum]KAH6171638.1 cytochrome P450 monooxygenase alt3 [Parastagonospora nodorum]